MFAGNLNSIEDELIPAIEVDPTSVTPGVIGFLVTFVLMVVVIFLVLDMVRRIRRVRYRREISDRLDSIVSKVEE
tara:strand:+ start:128 stop:352 length:225 start_codon:yes stop_codon:yes gene_type:complete